MEHQNPAGRHNAVFKSLLHQKFLHEYLNSLDQTASGLSQAIFLVVYLLYSSL